MDGSKEEAKGGGEKEKRLIRDFFLKFDTNISLLLLSKYSIHCIYVCVYININKNIFYKAAAAFERDQKSTGPLLIYALAFTLSL